MEAYDENLLSAARRQTLRYRSIQFEWITQDEIRLSNRISQSSGYIEFQQSDLLKSFHVHPQHSACSDDTQVRFHLSINDKPCRLILCEFFFNDLIRRCIPPKNLTDLPPVLRAAVIEAALDPLLSPCETAIGSKIAVIDMEWHSPDNSLMHRVFFSLELLSKAETTGYFSFDNELLPLFLKAAERLPSNKVNFRDYLPIKVRFEAGHTCLKLEELKAISTGDLIVADDCPLLNDQRLVIRIVPDLLFEGKLDANKLTVQRFERNLMDDKDNNTVIKLDELQVNLTFDVGEKNVPLREIETIQPGYIFELDRSVTSPVTIRANGQPIGKGELLQTDNNIAVRVLRLLGKIDG